MKFSSSPLSPFLPSSPLKKPHAGLITTSTSANFSPQKLSIRSNQESKAFFSSISRTGTPEPKRSLSYLRGSKLKSDFLQRITKKIDFDEERSPKKSELLKQARDELAFLCKNQETLQAKLGKISENMSRLSTAHFEEQSAMLSIMNKLDTLESLEENNQKCKNNEKITTMIEKVSKLESNYSLLKHHNTDNKRNFQQEMKEVNFKLQDLKECGEILKELVICLGKEPIVLRKSVQNAETLTEVERGVKEETIALERLDPENVLNDLLQQKEALVREKERMEGEYRIIPQNSKSMTNKRRKQALELELSMNYSKLMSLNSKIKRFAN
jgi:hypothetical protein